MDKNAFERYLTHYLDLYKDATGGLMGKRGLQTLLTTVTKQDRPTGLLS